MKYLEFASLLNGDAATIACLSTFQFDPDYFERRLMQCPALSKARRIMVFLDARQWLRRMTLDLPARELNRRYLVVPVWHAPGVFHAKLSLVCTAAGGTILCGSNNLTRAGCSSNLEILNASPFDLGGEAAEGRDLAREAFRFFARAVKDTDQEIGNIAGQWLKETRAENPWLSESIETELSQRKLRLLHTYDGSLWDRLVDYLIPQKPREFMVISPFHDANGEVCRRLARQWPSARIELVVQQGYTNLAVEPLKKLKLVRLSELRGVARRAHAKIIAWRTRVGAGCLVGSANFTGAALDGRNVEASLLISDSEAELGALFDGQLAKRAIDAGEFEPGSAEEPSADGVLPPLRITSAVLAGRDEVIVSFVDELGAASSALRLTLRTPGEGRPRQSVGLPSHGRSPVSVPVKGGALSDVRGSLLATLVGQAEGREVESPPVWVIQESRLTFEAGEGLYAPKSRIEESGEGLPEYLDELGTQAGQAAVVEYLRHLSIRFDDGSGGRGITRVFHIKMHDPFQEDRPPEWLIEAQNESGALEQVLLEFVDRHERQRLSRHAGRGNINGMQNFIDIFTTLIRLLYIYYRRGIVKKGDLIHRGCRLLEIATAGREAEEESLQGYLMSVYRNLGGDRALLQEACNEGNFLGQVRGALLILQGVRFNPGEQPRNGPKPTGPRDVLPTYARGVRDAIAACRLSEPGQEDVRGALEGYRMLKEEEVGRLLAELPEVRAWRGG